jgi:hypothetical protein
MIFPSELHFTDKRRLVDALLACACMATQQSRNLVISDLNLGISNQTDRHENSKQDVTSIVYTCLRFARGIESLLEIVENYEGGSIAWHQLLLVRYEISAVTVSGLTQPMLDRVKQLLRISPPADIVTKCFRQSCSDPSLIPSSEPQEAYEAFLRLFDFGAINALGFLDRLSAQLGDSTRAQQLRQLATMTADELGLTTQLQQLHEGILARNNAPVFLLVQLLPTPTQAETFTVQAWGWKDENDCRTLDTNDRPCQFPEVEKVVRKLLKEVEEQFETTDIVVELIVPRHLFCVDLTEWKIDVGEMEGVGSFIFNRPVALRWLNRFLVRRKHQRWHDKWKAVLNSLNGNGEIELKWLACADVCTPDHLINSYVAPDCGAYVGLGFVPPETPDTNDLLTISLNAGTPIAIWFRRIAAEECVTQQMVMDLVGEARLSNLPHRFRELRHGNREDNNHPAHRLTLLYDDYHRVPPMLVAKAPAQV